MQGRGCHTTTALLMHLSERLLRQISPNTNVTAVAIERNTPADEKQFAHESGLHGSSSCIASRLQPNPSNYLLYAMPLVGVISPQPPRSSRIL